MEDVTVPELREKLDDLLDRVEAGETIRITRDGEPITELRPLPRPTLTSEVVEMMKDLPPLDYQALRRDIDAVIDPQP